MPNFLTSGLKQTAVYWAFSGPDGAGGFSYDAAVEANVRWEDKQELFLDNEGRERLSRAVIAIDIDVVVGSYLYLGGIDDLPSDTTDPFCDETKTDAHEIKAFQKSPRLKRPTEFFRKVWI